MPRSQIWDGAQWVDMLGDVAPHDHDLNYLRLDGANSPMVGDVDFGSQNITNIAAITGQPSGVMNLNGSGPTSLIQLTIDFAVKARISTTLLSSFIDLDMNGNTIVGVTDLQAKDTALTSLIVSREDGLRGLLQINGDDGDGVTEIRFGKTGGSSQRRMIVNPTSGDIVFYKLDGGTSYFSWSEAAGRATIAQEGWTTPTLLNGWSNLSGFQATRFRKGADGRVHIQGIVTGGSTSVNTPFFILPIGYRPAATVINPSIMYNNVIARIDVSSNGEVRIGLGGAVNNWFNLTISFSID